MSLVGSEVDISIDQDCAAQACVSDDEGSVPDVILPLSGSHDDDDLHPPPSPPRAVERLFLHNLETQGISAAALAQQIHLSHRRFASEGWSGLSVNTDEFASATGWMTAVDDSDSLFEGSVATMTPHIVSARSDTFTPFSESDFDDDSTCHQSKFFRTDFLTRTSATPTVSETKMTTIAPTTAVLPSAPSSTNNNKIFPTQAPEHVDAAEKIYDTAKGVWAWGKGVTIVNPFLGLAEHVAQKLVGLAGANLDSVDGVVTEKLHILDDKVLNPALVVILGAVLGAAGKTEDVFKPWIVAILKPLGLIKETAENPEMTTVPGVTVQMQ